MVVLLGIYNSDIKASPLYHVALRQEFGIKESMLWIVTVKLTNDKAVSDCATLILPNSNLFSKLIHGCARVNKRDHADIYLAAVSTLFETLNIPPFVGDEWIPLLDIAEQDCISFTNKNIKTSI